MHARIAEIKARCPDLDTTRNQIIGLGATHQGHDHQIDTYFDVDHGRLKLRQGDIETNLIHYRRDDSVGPKDSHVLLHAPSDGDTLKATLTAALGVLVVVDKQRDIYWHGNVKLHLDHVAGLGAFVEIEAIDRDGSRTREELHEQCRHWMGTLCIGPDSLITQSYSDLLFRGHSALPGQVAGPGQQTMMGGPAHEEPVSTLSLGRPHLPAGALTDDDAGEVLTLQRAAYVSEAQLHSDVALPPLTQTLDELRAELGRHEVRAWGLRDRGRLVAAVRVTVRDHRAELGRLTVTPDRQGQGLGTRLLRHVEDQLPEAVDTLELFTGERSEANLRLYRRHGYHETHRAPAGHYDLVHMAKVLNTTTEQHR